MQLLDKSINLRVGIESTLSEGKISWVDYEEEPIRVKTQKKKKNSKDTIQGNTPP